MGETPGVLNRAGRGTVWALLLLPLTVSALLWLPSIPPVSSLAARWTITLLAWAIWFWGAWTGNRTQHMRLETLANVVEAIREGDYTVRATSQHQDAALEALSDEVNKLAGTLREERLGAREATAMVQEVIENMGAAIFALDGEQRLTLVNQKGAQWLGKRRRELLGSSVSQLGLASCLEGATRRIVDLELPRGPGRYEVRRVPIRVQGQAHEMLVLNDLTQALAAEERLAWKRLVQVLRHEINNSLAPIRSLAVTLRDRLSRSPRPAHWEQDLQQGLNVIVARSDALARIIEAYKSLTQLPPPSPSRFELKRWLEDAIALDSEIPIQLGEGPDIWLRADRGQLDQLLVNLLRNAMDAAGETGGDIEVFWSIASETDELQIAVADGGPGLSGKENLFVPFFTTKTDGTGIGLALSRQIAEGHGGRLTLENRQDRQGCVATLTLPRSAFQLRPQLESS